MPWILLIAIFSLSAHAFEKPSQQELRKMLTKLQYNVTQQDATEPAFDNKYWNHKGQGIYVDVVSGEALFSSLDKFSSGTGWPSFTKPINNQAVTTVEDKSYGMTRMEVRSRLADSHLGHVFNDGPAPTGKRYCINSASLRFVAKKDLNEQGYGQYEVLFAEKEVAANKHVRQIVFAGGCFWCMEPPFEKLPGVTAVESGYVGGFKKNPTYQQVAGGRTKYTEAVRVSFDPLKIDLEKLLEVYWRNIDPTDAEGQFVDRGSQYRPGIFYYTNEQKLAAEKSKNLLDKSKRFDKPIVVEVTAVAQSFYLAEDYHQDFYKKSPVRYKSYRKHSGRDEFIKRFWKDKKG